MLRLFFGVFLLAIASFCKSQNVIYRTNGDTIQCNITKIEEDRIFFRSRSHSNTFSTYLLLSDIAGYRYKNKTFPRPIEKPQNISKDLKKGKFWNIEPKQDSLSPQAPSNYSLFVQHEYKRSQYIYTWNDQLIEKNEVSFTKPLVGRSWFNADGEIFSVQQVKFYRNSSGLYANGRGLGLLEKNSFIPAIIIGNINLYQSVKSFSSSTHYNPATLSYTEGIKTKRIQNYYNTGFSDLKKANYRNLKPSLSNSVASMAHLRKYQRVKTTQIVFASLGGILALQGIRKIAGAQYDDPIWGNKKRNGYGYLFTGLASLYISYHVSIPKSKHLQNAISFYNIPE